MSVLNDNEVAIVSVKGKIVALFFGDGHFEIMDDDNGQVYTDVYRLRNGAR